MSEEGKKVKSKSYDNIKLIDNPAYKHHKEGDYVCEAEVEQEGKIICCMHDPIKGLWKWPVKGDN